MSALPKMQNLFLDGIFRADASIIGDIKPAGQLSAESRMNIYRNNTFLLLTDVLKEAFPAVTALASEAFFRTLAREFIKAHPPTAGDMNYYGAELPAFMRDFPAIQQHPYLVDVAQLEWLRQESYFSADAEPLADLEVDDLISLNLHPSLRFTSSLWPIDKLWKLGHGQIGVDEVDIKSGGANMVLFRQGGGIEMWTVPSSVLKFVIALVMGETVKHAALLASRDDIHFKSELHLNNLLKAGLITGNQK